MAWVRFLAGTGDNGHYRHSFYCDLFNDSVSNSNNIVCWMVSSGMLRHVALVRTDVSEELSATFIRVTRIGELVTMLAVTSNRHTLRSMRWLLVTASVVPSSQFLSPWWWRRYVPPKRRFLQEPHGVTSQKTPFFIVTIMKTSNLNTVC
jgi:hypothetical protein